MITDSSLRRSYVGYRTRRELGLETLRGLDQLGLLVVACQQDESNRAPESAPSPIGMVSEGRPVTDESI